MSKKTGASKYYFDEEAADKAVKFIESYLVHVKGELAGTPLILEDWQKDEIVRPLFGWKRADGTRKYRKCYIELPRKNAKSTLCAGLALLLLMADGEPGAEVYSAAADREQASIVFDIACQMAMNHKSLASRLKHYTTAKRLVFNQSASFYKALSADAFTKHGLNAHGIIFDELHAQPNRELWDVLTTSTGARNQPLIIAITTAGYNKNSICWEQHDYALKVRDGIIQDETFLPVIYAADPEADWTLEETWKAANPGYGVTIKPEYLAEACQEAQNSAAKENTFKRLHLNIWTEQDIRWLRMHDWEACPELPDMEQLLKEPCWGGLDLAHTTDTASFVLYFPESHAVLPYFWVPADNAHAREKRDKVPYVQWAKEGLIDLTPGNVIDFDRIELRLCQLYEKFNVQGIGFDKWSAESMRQRLDKVGIELTGVGQGFKTMSQPCKELEKLVIGHQLKHGNHKVLRWQASNVCVETDPAENLKMTKKRSIERIDGMVSLAMALAMSMSEESEQKTSIYSTDARSEGLLVI